MSEEPSTAETTETTEVPQEEVAVEEAPPVEPAVKLLPPSYTQVPGLEDLFNIFLEARGFQKDSPERRKQAAKLLADGFRVAGINPRDDMKEIETYINNMGRIANMIPDTPELFPAKAKIIGGAALRGAKKLTELREGTGKVDFAELIELAKLNAISRLAGVSIEEKPQEVVLPKEVQDKLNSLDDIRIKLEMLTKKDEEERRRREAEELIEKSTTPLKLMIEQQRQMIEGLKGQPSLQPEVDKALTTLQNQLDHINTRLDELSKKRTAQDLGQELQDIGKGIKSLNEGISAIQQNMGVPTGRMDETDKTLREVTTMLQKTVFSKDMQDAFWTPLGKSLGERVGGSVKVQATPSGGLGVICSNCETLFAIPQGAQIGSVIECPKCSHRGQLEHGASQSQISKPTSESTLGLADAFEKATQPQKKLGF